MVILYALLVVLVTRTVEGRSDYHTSIVPKTNTHFGDWGPIDWCPDGQYAYGFTQKVELDQGSSDDTAVNGVKLFCRTTFGTQTNITSTISKWGNWEKQQYCGCYEFLNGVRMKSEKEGWGWTTGADNFEFACKSYTSNQTYNLKGIGYPKGTWTDSVFCPPNTAICGIKTLVQKPQGKAFDDTALNAAIFNCCTLT